MVRLLLYDDVIDIVDSFIGVREFADKIFDLRYYVRVYHVFDLVKNGLFKQSGKRFPQTYLQTRTLDFLFFLVSAL